MGVLSLILKSHPKNLLGVRTRTLICKDAGRPKSTHREDSKESRVVASSSRSREARWNVEVSSFSHRKMREMLGARCFLHASGEGSSSILTDPSTRQQFPVFFEGKREIEKKSLGNAKKEFQNREKSQVELSGRRSDNLSLAKPPNFLPYSTLLNKKNSRTPIEFLGIGSPRARCE